MMDTPPELAPSIGFTLAEITRAILIGIGSITLWLLKKLGDKHIASLETVMTKQDLILDRIGHMDTRVSVLESKVNIHMHQEGAHNGT